MLVFSVLLCKMPFVQNGKKKSNMEDAAEPTPYSPRNTLAAYSGVQIPLISQNPAKNHALPIDRQGVLWYAEIRGKVKAVEWYEKGTSF